MRQTILMGLSAAIEDAPLELRSVPFDPVVPMTDLSNGNQSTLGDR